MCKMFVVVLLKVPCILKETRRETLWRRWLVSTYYVCVVATFLLPGFIRMAPMRFPHEPGLEQQAGDCNECFPTTWLGTSWFWSNTVWCSTFLFRYNVSSRNRHLHIATMWCHGRWLSSPSFCQVMPALKNVSSHKSEGGGENTEKSGWQRKGSRFFGKDSL